MSMALLDRILLSDQESVPVRGTVYSMLTVLGEEFDIVVLSQQTLCNHNASFCEATGRGSRVKRIFRAQTLHKDVKVPG